MPHAAAIIGGSIILAGTAFLVNELLIQPALERRRREMEEQEELDHAIAMSLYEYERAELERRAQGPTAAGPEYRYRNSEYGGAERPDANLRATATSSGRDAGGDPFSDGHAMRRRRGVARPLSPAYPAQEQAADPNLEMQEISSSAPPHVLFDAGPISRLDSSNAFGCVDQQLSPPPASSRPEISAFPEIAQNAPDSPFAQTAPSVSASIASFVSAPNDLRSPTYSVGSLDDTASLSDEDLFELLSPRSAPAPSMPLSPALDGPAVGETALDDLAHSLDSFAVIEPTRLERSSPAANSATTKEQRATSPAPTLRSLRLDTAKLGRPEEGDSPVVKDTPSSRSSTPFSELSAPQSYRAAGAASEGHASDRDSAWSDLGEESSSEEEVEDDGAARRQEVRRARLSNFAGKVRDAGSQAYVGA